MEVRLKLIETDEEREIAKNIVETYHSYVPSFKSVGRRIDWLIDVDGEIYEGLPIKRNDKFKASVTIMYGCNNFCTYCIVPYTRGRERSRKPELIIAEIKKALSEGFKEINIPEHLWGKFYTKEDHHLPDIYYFHK